MVEFATKIGSSIRHYWWLALSVGAAYLIGELACFALGTFFLSSGQSSVQLYLIFALALPIFASKTIALAFLGIKPIWRILVLSLVIGATSAYLLVWFHIVVADMLGANWHTTLDGYTSASLSQFSQLLPLIAVDSFFLLLFRSLSKKLFSLFALIDLCILPYVCSVMLGIVS